MAVIFENEAAWSTTAASNASVDTGINWAEGQDAATANNSARGMMSARRKATLDLCGGLVADVSGTADALKVTTNQVLSTAHLAAGLRLGVRAIADSTIAAVTLAADGLTPAPIKRGDGSALPPGAIRSGMMLDLVYNAGSSEWRAVNIMPASGSPVSAAAVASFRAYLSSAQSIVTSAVTKVTFDTETFDVGGYFASNKWTPPAGTVHVATNVTFANITANTDAVVRLFKNGSSISFVTGASPNTAFNLGIHMIDQANGTDYYEVYVLSADANYLISSNTLNSQFYGYLI